MTTFKEFMHPPHPELDKLATEAETARTTDEETVYESKENITNENIQCKVIQRTSNR